MHVQLCRFLPPSLCLSWGQACSQLLTHRIVEGILQQVKTGVHASTSYMYQPIGGLIEQLVMAMAEGKVNQLDTLLQTGLNRGLGIRGLMVLLDCERKGLYKPKSFTEEEMSHGLLFLRLGGARVASLVHQTLGTPTLLMLRYGSLAKSTITSLLPSAGFPTKAEIQCNIQVAFKNSHGSSRCGYVLMIDEIKVEERMRWDPSTNSVTILGLCWEHMEHVGLDFCSMSDAAALVQGILRGEIHHASEAMVFSIRVLLDSRHASGSRRFIIAGTCKQEGCARHARLISTVIEACNAEILTIGCPLFSIASDGESHRGSALTMLTHRQPLEPGSELMLLGKLRLMNMLVGDNNIMADKDYKHIMKHCRNFTICKSGVMVNGFAVTPTLLCFHLQANKVPSHQIAYLLNPADQQDVPLCYTLIKEIWSLPPPALTDKPGFVAARVLPFIQVSLSLYDQLVHLSATTHLSMFLFTIHDAQSKAMPSLTFKDIILLVKNAYFCTAKAKIYTPNGNLYLISNVTLILNGTNRLESTFGAMQMMVGNDVNANILTLGYHLSHAVECLNILSEHPMWDRGPRHLHLHGIEDGNGDMQAKCDHITPESWEGCVNVWDISLVTSWNLRRQMVSSEFPAIDIEGALQELESKGYAMEFPFGQVAESPEESDDNDKGNSECHILFLGQVTHSD
ncbi:hypothetical protein EI94DRAFT_1773743 [Lactarius quietus]|nr:hypothetical protein EI94DRAFT_1773743 [Lactarius quietus]